MVFGTVFARFSLFVVAHTGEHGVGIDINVLRRDYGKVQVRRVAVSGVANVAYKLALNNPDRFCSTRSPSLRKVVSSTMWQYE